MRIPFLFLPFLMSLHAPSAFSHDQLNKENPIVIVVSESKPEINLDTNLHEIAKVANVKTIIDLKSYKSKYFKQSSNEIVFSEIKQRYSNSRIYSVTNDHNKCSYDIFNQTVTSDKADIVERYFYAKGCAENVYQMAPAAELTKPLSSEAENFPIQPLPTLPVVSFSFSEIRLEKLNTIVTLPLTRSGSPQDLSTFTEVVVYSTAKSATENVDYVPFSKVVRFEAGQTQVDFDFELFESDGESDEFEIGLRYPVNGEITTDPNSFANVSVKLYSDTKKDTFAITKPATAFLTEGEDYTLSVARQNSNQLQIVEYTVELIGIGQEFVSDKKNFIFQPGVTKIESTFKVNDDFKFNKDQRYVNFKFKETPKIFFPNGAVASFAIGDNRRGDRGSFGFEHPKYVVGNEMEMPTINVIRKNPSPDPVSFMIQLSDVNAAFSANYKIDFANGQNAVKVPMSDIPKRNSTIDIKLIPLVDSEMFQPNTRLNVVDLGMPNPEVDTLKINTNVLKVEESTSSFTLVLEREGKLDYVGQLTLKDNQGSAVLGKDYSIRESNITFTTSDKTKNVVIDIKNDEIFTGDKTIKLVLESKNLALAQRELSIELVEDDLDKLGTFSFARTDLRVEEEQLNIPIVVKRDIPGPAVDILLNVQNDTAKENVDFVWSGTRVLNFAAGQTEVVTYINMIGDKVPDFDKKFTLKLSSPKKIQFGSNSLQVIVDDNEKENAVYVKPSGDSIQVSTDPTEPRFIKTASDDKAIKFTLTRSGNTKEVLKVFVKSVNDTATAGVHFNDVNETFLFAAGETSKTITLVLKKAVVTGSSNDFLINITSDSMNYIPENPALKVKITPMVDTQVPGGDKSGGSMSMLFLMCLCMVYVARNFKPISN